MTKMFDMVARTWNPVVGCEHGCSYCYARKLALGKLNTVPRYRDFKPKLVEEELRRTFYQGLIFVSNMGDLWGQWVPAEWIEKVLDVVRLSPRATFLMLTKNPARYHEFPLGMPPNVILGATVESDTEHCNISTAPPPGERLNAMQHLPNSVRRMISIEPIMNFNFNKMVRALSAIKPEFVYVGYDNYGCGLPEPPRWKVRKLIAAISCFATVKEKTLREASTPEGKLEEMRL